MYKVSKKFYHDGLFKIVVSLIITLATSKHTTIKVNIPNQGLVLGSVDETSWTKQKFFSFRGIPYAQSPSGNLRFKPPKQRAPWQQTLDVRKVGKPCPAMETVNNLHVKGDLEDCLNLSVYSKSLNATRPVMFHIHGGAYVKNSAPLYPPHYLMEKDIVLVVVQYRLGALGFTTTFTKEMPGNAAIMDLLMALKWVQKNIHVFGGDADKVTLFGQSAGAGLICALVLSPKTSKNYFKRSIVQSYSIFSPRCLNRQPLPQVKRICEAIGCVNCKDRRKQYECLMKADAVKLLNASSQEMFGPVIGDIYGVLPEEPKTLAANFDRTVPLMLGFTKHDGSFLLAKSYDKILTGSLANTTVRKFVSTLTDMSKDYTGFTTNFLLRLLFEQNILDTNNHTAAWPAYFDIASDINYKSPVLAFARAMLRRKTPIYLYSFDYVGEHSRFGYDFNISQYPFRGGVHHADDNIYLFDIFKLG